MFCNCSSHMRPSLDTRRHRADLPKRWDRAGHVVLRDTYYPPEVADDLLSGRVGGRPGRAWAFVAKAPAGVAEILLFQSSDAVTVCHFPPGRAHHPSRTRHPALPQGHQNQRHRTQIPTHHLSYLPACPAAPTGNELFYDKGQWTPPYARVAPTRSPPPRRVDSCRCRSDRR